VRSYVGSYAKLLGLPPELAEDIIRDKPAPELVYSGSGSGARQMLDRSVRNVAYLLMTAAIVGSIVMLVMHFQSPAKMAQVLPLDPPIAAAEKAVTGGHALTLAPVSNAAPISNPAASAIPAIEPSANAAVTNEGPVLASLAPSMPATSSAGGELVLTFREQSWLEVIDSKGQRIERGLVAAGSERRFSAGQISRITLGNAQVVDVVQGGRRIDMAPFREANIARFSLSSQGNIVPSDG
jgi:cytoskeleton protein RodZ